MAEPVESGPVRADLPAYHQLPVASDAPPRSSWGVWGDGDVLGCLNLITPAKVAEAAKLVRAGKVFALNWAMELPDPPLFGRRAPVHRVLRTGSWQDDELSSWNTQSSSQWDGFRHVRAEPYGYYGGVPNEQHGIDHWAAKGIAGRGLLVDIGRYRERTGRPLRMLKPDPITVEELSAAIAESGCRIREGDILLLRTGWIEWYMSCGQAVRDALATELNAPGLRPGTELLAFLWDSHIAAIAADNPAVELFSSSANDTDEADEASGAHDRAERFAHYALLPLLGLPLGEFFDLGDLAADCAADGVYEGLFTSAPLNIRGGVASPPNALMIKLSLGPVCVGFGDRAGTTCRLAAPGGDADEHLEHDSIREEGRDLASQVIRRADLDHFGADDRKFERAPPYGIEQLGAGEAADLRSSGAWRERGVDDIDINRQEDRVAPV